MCLSSHLPIFSYFVGSGCFGSSGINTICLGLQIIFSFMVCKSSWVLCIPGFHKSPFSSSQTFFFIDNEFTHWKIFFESCYYGVYKLIVLGTPIIESCLSVPIFSWSSSFLPFGLLAFSPLCVFTAWSSFCSVCELE